MWEQCHGEVLKDFGGPGKKISKVHKKITGGKRETKKTLRHYTSFGGEWGRWRVELSRTMPNQRGILQQDMWESHMHDLVNQWVA